MLPFRRDGTCRHWLKSAYSTEDKTSDNTQEYDLEYGQGLGLFGA